MFEYLLTEPKGSRIIKVSWTSDPKGSIWTATIGWLGKNAFSWKSNTKSLISRFRFILPQQTPSFWTPVHDGILKNIKLFLFFIYTSFASEFPPLQSGVEKSTLTHVMCFSSATFFTRRLETDGGRYKLFYCEEVTLKINWVLAICINLCDSFSSSGEQQQQQRLL